MHQRGVVWKYRDEMDQNLPQVLEPYNLDHLTVSLLKCKKEKLSRDIYAAHSDDFFYKNKYTCERSKIEISQKNMSSISSLTHYNFSLRKFHRNENRFLIHGDL